jgi:hypothetical protein
MTRLRSPFSWRFRSTVDGVSGDDGIDSNYWLPLADVLLVLITFTALLIPVRMDRLDPAAGYLPVRIDLEGQPTIQGEAVPIHRLPAVVQAYASRNPQGRLRLIPDPEASWGVMRPVMLMLKDSPMPVELRLPNRLRQLRQQP